MFRSVALCALVAAPLAVYAQVQISSNVVPVPLEPNVAVIGASLPDAPSAMSSSMKPMDGQAGVAPGPGSANRVVASKYAGIILPGQKSVPLTAGNKVIYGFADAFNPFAFVGVTLSAGYSHLVNSAPHYGTNAEAFGKREGASALRNTVQTLSTDAVFAPIFHDDPRYYELGAPHKFVSRVVYAATRVVITRSDDGRSRLNAPLLLGYGVAAGMNNLYYPDQDTGGKQTAESYGTSLVGAALGMEANEFLDDALRIVHLRK
jgi:hypothetical protein